MQLLLGEVPSPIGTLLLVSDGASLRALDFHDFAPRMHRLLGRYCSTYSLCPAPAGDFGRRVESYFAGNMTAFDPIPVQTGGTAFQRRVWAKLRESRPAPPPPTAASPPAPAARPPAAPWGWPTAPTRWRLWCRAIA